MENLLNGSVEELLEVKDEVCKAEKLKEDMLESEKLLKENDKEVETQRKAMNDKIDSAVKSRREELSKYHDKEVGKEKKALKSIKKSRKTAKSKAVGSRISDATEGLQAENRKLNGQIREMFKQAKIPAFCNTTYYYALYNPATVRDFIILAITAVAAIAVIPNVVCLLVNTTTFLKVLLYIGIVVFFFLVYFVIFVITKKDSKSDVISKGRSLRRKIGKNKRSIRATAREIRGDEDESPYGLEEFDEDIQETSSSLKEKETAMEDALSQFDNVTAVDIRNEIEQQMLPGIEQLEADGKALKADYQKKKTEYETLERTIKSAYAPYLGERNTTPEKISTMIDLIENGQAETVMQALDLMNGETMQ